jgi:hypothetical protein
MKFRLCVFGGMLVMGMFDGCKEKPAVVHRLREAGS